MGRAQWLSKQNGRKAVLYVVKLYGNEGEQPFYKIGITFNLAARFARLRFAGYKWRTVARYGSWSAGRVFDLEERLHMQLKPYSCRPFLPFAGLTECYGEVEPLLAALPRVGTFVLKIGVDI
ncbi:GIY-YIG nuclease family protein [Hymenobacter lapidarius]|nr:GIY-YIG nuclease family protein [Hymenobacter lapidarius]